jgi:hypothetical protein
MAAKASAPRSGGVADWRVTAERRVQPAKAEEAITVTEAGKVTEVRAVQSAKAEEAMAVTKRYAPL